MLLDLHQIVRQPQVADLARAPQQHVLDEPAGADERHRRGGGGFEQIVDRRDTAVRVAGRARKAQELAGALPVDRETGAGDRAGPERVLVRALVGGENPGRVALPFLDHGQQIVRERRRLRRLGMRVRGKDRLAVPARDLEQRAPEREHRVGHVEERLPQSHPVHRHVDVVAAAGGVQAARELGAGRAAISPST